MRNSMNFYVCFVDCTTHQEPSVEYSLQVGKKLDGLVYYSGNIVIFSRWVHAHVSRLTAVLGRIKMVGLKLCANTCQIARGTITYRRRQNHTNWLRNVNEYEISRLQNQSINYDRSWALWDTIPNLCQISERRPNDYPNYYGGIENSCGQKKRKRCSGNSKQAQQTIEVIWQSQGPKNNLLWSLM